MCSNLLSLSFVGSLSRARVKFMVLGGPSDVPAAQLRNIKSGDPNLCSTSKRVEFALHILQLVSIDVRAVGKASGFAVKPHALQG